MAAFAHPHVNSVVCSPKIIIAGGQGSILEEEGVPWPPQYTSGRLRSAPPATVAPSLTPRGRARPLLLHRRQGRGPPQIWPYWSRARSSCTPPSRPITSRQRGTSRFTALFVIISTFVAASCHIPIASSNSKYPLGHS